MNQLHVVYENRTRDFYLRDLDLGDLSTDADIRAAAARAVGVAVSKFASYVIDRVSNGEIMLRPDPTFG